MNFKIYSKPKLKNWLGFRDSEQLPRAIDQHRTAVLCLIIFGFACFSTVDAYAWQDSITIPELGNEPQTQTRLPSESPAFDPGTQNTPANQTPPTTQQPNKPKPKPKPQKTEEILIPPPATVTLETSDRVNLVCTYYGAAQNAASSSGKQTLPFILLHDWGGSRQDLDLFAKYLQRLGCAVIVPDLRGHGESTSVVGVTKPIDYEKFRKFELESIANDIERCKKYLVQRNNDGELNIDLLNILAVGKTAVLAMNWSIADWSWPQQGPIKQGKDVKSLILVSPRKKLETLSLMPAMKHPLFSGRAGINLPTLLVWGEGDESAAKDGASMLEYMKKGRPDVEEIEDPAEKLKQTTLYNAAIPRTNMTGSELIRDGRTEGFYAFLARFVASQVGAHRDDYQWQSREKD